MKKKKTRVISILLLVVFSFAALEIILRITGYIYIETLFTSPGYESEDTTNILVLGESSTAGLWVTWNESYPMQLEQKMQKEYPKNNIRVIVPPHMGQNTGHMSNRIDAYLQAYDPRILIIMAGYNNEWSLTESHIGRFTSGADSVRLNIISFLENFRVYRLSRFIFLHLTQNTSLGKDYILGGPEYDRYPPAKEVYSFALDHQKEFIELWRYDMKTMIAAAKKQNTTVILMTYHINPSYLPAAEFEKIAEEEDVMLIRNNLSFRPLVENGKIREYIFKTDNWHPNYKGYSIIAENIAEKIIEKKLLG